MTTRTGAKSLPRMFVALLCFSFVLGGAAYGVLAPQLVKLEEKFVFSDTLAGVLSSCYTAGMLPGVIAVMLAGARVTARPLYLFSLVAMGLATFGFGLAQSYEVLLLTRGLQGVAAGVLFAGGTAWLTDSAPTGDRGAMVGISWGGLTIGGVLGPAIGVLSQYVGAVVLYGALGAIFSAIAAALARYRFATRKPGDSVAAPPKNPASGRPALLSAISLLVVPAMVIGGLNVLLPLTLDELQASGLTVAAVFLTAAATGGLASPFIGRLTDRVGSKVMLAAGLVLATMCASTLAVAHADVVIVACAGVLYLGVVNELCAIPAVSAALAVGSIRGAASVSAAVAGVYAVFETIGALIAVPLSEHAGKAAPFVGLAVATVLSGLLLGALTKPSTAAS